MSPPQHVKVPPEVAALVRGLHPVLKRKVRAALQVILDDPYTGKALCNELQGLRSYRVGRLRIIYRLRRDVALVAIGPRDSIYVETYRRIHEPRGRYRLRGSPGGRESPANFTDSRLRTRICRPLAPRTREPRDSRRGRGGIAPQSAASS
ncbi:MAG: type II toxin-antitoxin system RelE/ParE family toxin [Thiotrichales bacterium]|nr:type II toxin-antitoxin system RelE/ParE family toxin [Thiotrichales bacterium]